MVCWVIIGRRTEGKRGGGGWKGEKEGNQSKGGGSMNSLSLKDSFLRKEEKSRFKPLTSLYMRRKHGITLGASK